VLFRHTFHGRVRAVLTALFDLVAPPACLACRRPPAGLLCPDCRVALTWLGADVCPGCGLPQPCGRRCPAGRLAFERAWAPLAYAGPARAVVAALKERGAVPVAGLMAAQIAAAAPPELLAGATLVPVPADPWRRRARGVDHTGRLARELGRRCERPVARALVRRPSRSERHARMRRAERLAGGHLPIAALPGRAPDIAVLVDDVHTTGATLHACAEALRAAGASSVRAITYARTL
jgi:predicted amidophosphoribosyltransferase